jgi:hypothetical protein
MTGAARPINAGRKILHKQEEELEDYKHVSIDILHKQEEELEEYKHVSISSTNKRRNWRNINM